MVVQEQDFASQDFAAELTDFVGRLIEEQRQDNGSEWKAQLAGQIQVLVEKYLSSKPQAQFVVGDDSYNLFDDPPDAEEKEQEKDVLPLASSVAPPAATQLASLESANIDDATILKDLRAQKLKHRDLEAKFGSTRAVELRRMYMQELVSNKWLLHGLPYKNYDYSWVNGACCENIIGTYSATYS